MIIIINIITVIIIIIDCFFHKLTDKLCPENKVTICFSGQLPGGTYSASVVSALDARLRGLGSSAGQWNCVYGHSTFLSVPLSTQMYQWYQQHDKNGGVLYNHKPDNLLNI